MSHTRMSRVAHIGTQAQRHCQASAQSKNGRINACSNFTREWKQQDRVMTPSPFRSWNFLTSKYFRKFVHLRRQLLTSKCQRKIKCSMHNSSWPLQHSHHTASHCITLHHTASHCITLQHNAIHCNTLQCTATHCNALQHTATYCNTLQHTAIHGNTLQHTATHCNTGVPDLVSTLECFWALLQVFPVWHDQSMCVTWPIHVCDMTNPCVWYDQSMCVIWMIRLRFLFHTCHMTLWYSRCYFTHSHVWHDFTYSYVWHDSCKFVTWLTHILDMAHWYVSRHCLIGDHFVPWLIHM